MGTQRGVMPGRERISLPRNVVALGMVSLLMGTSSQMIHSLLPLFLVIVLGASTVSVGIIEGVAASPASGKSGFDSAATP